MNARELLEIAAEYVDARHAIASNPELFVANEDEELLSGIAEKFDAGLKQFSSTSEP